MGVCVYIGGVTSLSLSLGVYIYQNVCLDRCFVVVVVVCVCVCVSVCMEIPTFWRHCNKNQKKETRTTHIIIGLREHS